MVVAYKRTSATWPTTICDHAGAVFGRSYAAGAVVRDVAVAEAAAPAAVTGTTEAAAAAAAAAAVDTSETQPLRPKLDTQGDHFTTSDAGTYRKQPCVEPDKRAACRPGAEGRQA